MERKDIQQMSLVSAKDPIPKKESKFKTAEQINLKSTYTVKDLDKIERSKFCCRDSSLFAWALFHDVCS